MTESFDIVLGALTQVWFQMLVFVPKIIVAIIIWVIGVYLVNLGVALIRKIDIRGAKIDDYLIGVFSSAVLVVGKILVILVVLDFLGVGRTIVGAIANGLTLAIAIALGLSFGKALEEDAKWVVGKFKKHLERK